jgi:hypothetical protein
VNFFLLVNDHIVSLDRVVFIKGDTAVAPFAARQLAVFVEREFGLGHAQILRNLMLGCGDFLAFDFRKEPKPMILKSWLGGLDWTPRLAECH